MLITLALRQFYCPTPDNFNIILIINKIIFKLLTFEMGIGVDLARKQSVSQIASTQINCSNTADFIPKATKFHHGTDHVYTCSCLNIGFHNSI